MVSVLSQQNLAVAGRGTEQRIFTEHVRRLAEGAEPPSEAEMEAVLDALTGALKAELRRRGLSEAPPRFLGVTGHERWDGAALEELAIDAYAFNFVDRLRSLAGQLRVKPNIDGLVFRNLKNLLHERQKRHDPIGFRVFEAVRSALRTAVEADQLEVIRGPPRVHNETVLAFPGATASHPADLDAAGIAELVAVWSDELLPELVTARGRRRQAVLDRLRRRLPDLDGRGVAVFSFKDLVDLFKREVRSRWAALRETEEGELAFEDGAGEGDEALRLVPTEHPFPEIAEREAFTKLVDCVGRGIEEIRVTERVRSDLADVWQVLRTAAVEEESMPSQRKLATLLDIPRDRFPELYRRLGALIETCRRNLAGRAGERTNHDEEARS